MRIRSDEDSEEEDDTAELLRELEKIKRERAETLIVADLKLAPEYTTCDNVCARRIPERQSQGDLIA